MNPWAALPPRIRHFVLVSTTRICLLVASGPPLPSLTASFAPVGASLLITNRKYSF